ncbi:DNA cytosine methyltransferase [Spiroplasma endosymbiont of Nebria brevicollis]|uniref:DNA cytosine methyltransferase n=1 Tax=Spiroplasma endosymbiont of Nebria brevicollis TaxID=3066284 RepID=UPI00313B59F1
MEKYNVLSLFSGCGGLDLGFKKQGFKIVKAIDNDPTLIETYKKNIANHIECLDIKQINGLTYLKEYKTIDVVIGGPPCQGFSLASNLVRNFKDDPRNYLYKEYIRIIEQVKPKFFLMENVKNFLSFNSGKFKDDIIENFKTIGYSIEYKIIKSVEYGIPQQRESVFYWY